MNNLEKQLCCIYGQRYGVYTGNGTTAMYLVFQALKLQKKKAVFPAISCTNPVNAALFAGYRVDFCDINLDNYTMDSDYLEDMLKTGEYGIVVPTHIYGNICDMEKITDVCHRYGAVVLEDAAQAEGIHGGDVSITSFGHTKLFETNAGGGIAFTDDENVYRNMEAARELLPDKPSDSDKLFDRYREDYYSIVRTSTSEEDKNTRLKELQLKSKEIFVYDSRTNNEVLDIIKKRDDIISERRIKQEIYSERLNHKYIMTMSDKNNSTVSWRYTFLYNGNRDAMVDAVRKHGIDISTWYPSLAGIYKNEHLTNADIVSNKVVNLWVDESHTKDRIIEEIDVINDCMEAAYNGR